MAALQSASPLLLVSTPVVLQSRTSGMRGRSPRRELTHSFHDVQFVNIWLTFSKQKEFFFVKKWLFLFLFFFPQNCWDKGKIVWLFFFFLSPPNCSVLNLVSPRNLFNQPETTCQSSPKKSFPMQHRLLGTWPQWRLGWRSNSHPLTLGVGLGGVKDMDYGLGGSRGGRWVVFRT